MDLWDLVKLMFHRWYVALPMVLLTLAATVTVFFVVKPEYQATGYLQLIPPAASADEADKAGRVRNPWSDLGVGALAQVAEIKAQNQNTIKSLKAAGFPDSFTIAIDEGSPRFTVMSVASTQEQAIATTNEVMRVLEQAVIDQQTQYKIAPQDSITTLRLNSELDITTVTLKVKRALIIAFAVGVLLTFGVTIAIDAMIRRRGKRGQEEQLPQPDPGPVMPRLAYDRPGGVPNSRTPAYGAYRSGSYEDGMRPALGTSPPEAPTMAGSGSNGERPAVFVDYHATGDRPAVTVSRVTPGPAPTRAPAEEVPPTVDAEFARPDTTIVLPLSNAKWSNKTDKSGR